MTLSSTIYVTPTGYFQKSGPRLVWRVEIRDGDRTLTGCLEDPFNTDEHDACRWYLERYSQDSFDAPKANRAAFKLSTYGARLAEQLELSLSVGDVVDLVISEGPLAPGSAARTIHRLYWELLESPSAWGLDTLDVRVRRVAGHHTVLPLSTSRLMPPGSPKVIQILHVAARSRGLTPNHRKEVSPQMSLTVLAQISHDLKRHNCPRRLNITTIRPGTFEELKACLNQRREQGGHNMFHLIHFDLHGEASPEKGAQLLFEDDGGRLREVSSADVADALAGFPVPFVVLNACRSARADLGSEANTAAILSRRGSAENILAMSFQALSVAAEAFLRVFYAEFLLRGASFASAARHGRRALEGDKGRRGHLNRPLELTDWFIPVVYGSVQDHAIAPHVDFAEPRMTVSIGDRVVGRDFSVGELENILLTHRKACLRGHAGIGKSTFLKYASRIWEETGFADAFAWVDLASSTCRSRDSIVALLLDQLSLPTPESAEERRRLLLSHVQDGAKVLVVVDSLEAAFSACRPEDVPASTAVDMAALLTQLCSACVQGKRGSMMLLSGRRAGLGSPNPRANSRSDALFGWLEKGFKECTMELRGLDLGHSMELSENVLRDVGQAPRSVTVPGTRDSLELLGRLCLGIPGLIHYVLRFAHAQGLPWRDVRGRLLDGEPTIYGAFVDAVHADELFLEFRTLWSTLPPERLLPLLVLGIYWHQGPYEAPFSQAMVAFGVCGSQADAEWSLEFASERRYIESASYKRKLRRISFIHPLFTLFCRVTLQGCLQVVSSRRGRDNRPPNPKKHLHNAIRFYATVVSKDFNEGFFDEKILDWFLQDVDYQRAYQIICHDEASSANTAFDIQIDPQAGHFLNTLSCFRLCLDRPRATAPASWPLDHFVGIAPLVMHARTAPEATLFADGYEQLLDRLLESEQAALDEPLHIRFFVTTAINLAVLRRMHANANHGSRWKDLVKEARQQCGRLEASAWELSAMQLLSAFEVDFDDPASVVEFLSSQGSPFSTRDCQDWPPSIEPNVELADSAARGLLRSPELAQKIRGQIRGVPDCLRFPPPQTDQDTLREQLINLLRAAAPDDGGRPNIAPPHDQPAKLIDLVQNIYAFFPPEARRMFTDRSAEWLSNQPGALMSKRPGGERQLLMGRASAALASGDWAALRSSYLGLYQYHSYRLELRQANEYLEELIRILEADPATSDDAEKFRNFQRDQVKSDLYRQMIAAEVAHGGVGETPTDAGIETELPPISYDALEQIQGLFQELELGERSIEELTAASRVWKDGLTILARIDEAEASGAWDDALAAAAELEEHSGRNPIAQGMDRDHLLLVRPEIECRRDMITRTRGWYESVASSRLADARRELEGLEEVPRKWATGPLRDTFPRERHDKNLAFIRWAQSVREMGAASRALPEAGGGAADGEDEAAVEDLDGLLSRDETFFDHGSYLFEAPFVEALLDEARRARRKHLLRLAVARNDTAAAEKLRAELDPPPVPPAPQAPQETSDSVWVYAVVNVVLMAFCAVMFLAPSDEHRKIVTRGDPLDWI